MSSFRTVSFRLLVAAASLGLIALTLYTLVLDQQIRQRFAGARWALPAQIYAAPLELYPGAPLTRPLVVQELERLGYRRVSRGELAQGRYVQLRDEIELQTRPFAFTDGPQDTLRARLRFGAEGVESLRELDSSRSLPLLRLEPLLIGSIYPRHGEDRVLVRLDEVPPLLPLGLIQTEDQRFHAHFGLDPKAIARASVANLKAGRVVQGGSTLTQQLVKNFFLHNTRSFSRKFSEAIYSLLLELHYSKEEILEAYLNEVYLGQDGERAIHGFGLGSEFFFRKPLAELQPAELATLVGMVKGPSYYNPRRYPERTRERRDLVLGQWRDAGLLDEASYARASSGELRVVAGQALGNRRYPAFIAQVHRELAHDYPDDVLTAEGLRIFTSLVPHVQAAAEDAVREGLLRIEKDRRLKDLQAAAVVASVTDGSINALVGDRQATRDGFNRALDARRPVGSTIKPVVYLAALQRARRFQLTSPVNDTAIVLDMPNGDRWQPSNYDGEAHGQVPLFHALAHSYNLATVQLGLELGLDKVIDTLRQLGVKESVPELPSLLLGAWDRSPWQLTQLYAALASGGYAQRLTSIRAVQTRDGDLARSYPLELNEPLPAEAVALINWALVQATQQGTGRGIYRVLDPQTVVAGKTGTSDDLRDSWFAGFGANYLGVVWVGHDDNRPTGLTGASGALPIWAELMRRAGLRGLAPPNVENLEWARIDAESFLPAPKGCRSVLRIPFVAGTVPDQRAPCASDSPWERFMDLWQ